MKPKEIRATGRLATKTLADTVSHVQDLHGALASRVFTLTAPTSLPARVVHDGVATGVYAGIRVVGQAAGLAVTELVSAAVGSATPVGSTPRSNLALAALNALQGDQLTDQNSPLAIGMAIRCDRQDVAPRPDALAVAFPGAASKLALFVHGLGETEESWRRHADRHGGDAPSTYGSRLAHDFGYTPVYLRYNTGLHVSTNGRHLATLLDQIMGCWPVPVAEVILVGHSMGGLVVRSACHYAEEADQAWAATVRHVFYLGTPHSGAGIARWVSSLAGVLDKLDESRPLADLLDRRSAGIKDLGAGLLLDDDWIEAGPGSRRPAGVVPLSPSARHYAVSATVTTSRRNPLGRLVGDLLVQPASARGRSRCGRQIPFPVEHTRHFGGLHHFHLLNHPLVYAALRDWLESTSARASADGDFGAQV